MDYFPDLFRANGSERSKKRFILVFLIFSFFFLILFLRFFYLQILKGEEFARLSKNNCIRLQSINPDRGLIYDRNEELLVDNRPAYDLFIVPSDARPLDEILEKLSLFSKIPVFEFYEKLEKHKGPSYRPCLLKQDLSRDVIALLAARRYELPGVRIEVKPRRQYMYPGLGAHITGYIGEASIRDLQSDENDDLRGGDFIGKAGVERSYDKLLRGKRGGRQVEVNARGQLVRVLQTVPAEPGANLYLTIDKKLQMKAEELMEDKVGAIVGLDPDNGQVLCMVSSPSFDQNLFASGIGHKQWQELLENPYRPMENKAIHGLYPPASIYKIVSAIAGLEEGFIEPSTRFFCSGSLQYGDRHFRCWKRGGHGSLNVAEALEHSCDVYFYNLAQRLGVDRLAWYARAFGFAKKTGIDLDNEESGLIPTAAWKKRRFGVSWQGGESLSVIIGQGYNLVSCIQSALMISAVGNGGTLYRPRLVYKIQSAEGRLLSDFQPEVSAKLPVSDENLELVRKALRDVVNSSSGTARAIRDAELDIAGKTGTAQVLSRKSEEETSSLKPGFEPHAWFVAFAPYEKPEIALAVIVEHGEAGSSVAAPIASELIRTYLKKE